MAKTSTVYRFRVELADIDRHVYERLDLRVACHPSEDLERMVLRVIARVMEHEEGLEFGRGLSTTEDAALWTRDSHGGIRTWIDVGCPGADRLHRASKAADRVLVYTTKAVSMLRKEWSSRPIHKSDEIRVVRISQDFVSALAGRLDRTAQWYLTVQDGLLSVVDGTDNVESEVERTSLTATVSS